MMFPQVTILKKKRSAIFVNRLGSQRYNCVISVREDKKFKHGKHFPLSTVKVKHIFNNRDIKKNTVFVLKFNHLLKIDFVILKI